ncbi:MAG: VWA domain-containing protein [Candidatus Hydrogenedentes bacterium]|nr:VWA domain-containing protein [Candidatus Hydrogenedentota bacterium]
MKFAFAFPLSRLHWWLGAALAALALVVVVLRVLEGWRRTRLERFAGAGVVPRLLVGYDERVRRPLFWLTVFGVAFLALALAQPRWGQSWQEVRKYSRDIIICLDTSESMRAVNPLPNRLERAKQKIRSLLERALGDRFGLVAFSGAAALQCPLTMDHGYFRAVLNAVDTDTISMEGTDIAATIREAVRVFEDDERSSGVSTAGSRGILIISDGEQVSGDAVEAAKEASAVARVFVIGVGDPNGAEVEFPEWMSQAADASAVRKPHRSKLDEDTLMRVATEGNGAYIRARVDSWDIEQIYDRFAALSEREVEGDVRYQLVNRYRWPLAAALLCFAGEGLWLVLLPWLRWWRMRRPEGRHGHA